MTSSETRLHSREGTVGFEMVGDLFVNLAFEDLRKVLGNWEEVLLFSMDFTVSQCFFEFVLQDANFCLKKLALAFLCILVPNFPEKLYIAGAIQC